MPSRTLNRFVTELNESLSNRAGGDADSEAELRRRLSTVVRSCGWKMRSHQRMDHLEKSLEGAHIYPSEDLTDLSLPLGMTIRFRREAPEAPALEFAHEKDLERFLAKNHRILLGQIEYLRGSRHLAGGTRPQRRYAFGRSYVKPDLVFRAPDGTIIIAEVKLGDPDDRAVTQLRKYLRAASKQHSRVRGLLISGRPSSRAHAASIADEISAVKTQRIDWMQYSADMTLTSTR